MDICRAGGALGAMGSFGEIGRAKGGAVGKERGGASSPSVMYLSLFGFSLP